MNLTEARAVIESDLESKTATIDDQSFVESISVGKATATDCKACLQFRINRYEGDVSKAIDNGGTSVSVSWEFEGEVLVADETEIHRFGPGYLDHTRRAYARVIPRALYPIALARLSELYGQLYG